MAHHRGALPLRHGWPSASAAREFGAAGVHTYAVPLYTVPDDGGGGGGAPSKGAEPARSPLAAFDDVVDAWSANGAPRGDATVTPSVSSWVLPSPDMHGG